MRERKFKQKELNGGLGGNVGDVCSVCEGNSVVVGTVACSRGAFSYRNESNGVMRFGGVVCCLCVWLCSLLRRVHGLATLHMMREEGGPKLWMRLEAEVSECYSHCFLVTFLLHKG